jgi:hypothetical protein
MSTEQTTAELISRDAEIERELDSFDPASDIDRFEALCDEQARIYSAVADRDAQTAKGMLR